MTVSNRILVFALLVTAFGVPACQDSRISVEQFVEMQRKMGVEVGDGDLGAYEKLTSNNEKPAEGATMANSVESHAFAMNQPPSPVHPKPNFRTPTTPVRQKTVNRRPATTSKNPAKSRSASAIRKERVVQVRNGNGVVPPLDDQGEGRWFFDPVRGEWIRRIIPTRQLGVKTVSIDENCDEPETLDPETMATDEIEDSQPVTSQPYENETVDSDAWRVNVTPNQPIDASTFALPDPNHNGDNQIAKKPYVVGAEDVLTVALTGLTGVDNLAEPAEVNVRVARDGSVNLPLVGAINIGGMDIVEAEAAIRRAYVPRFVPTLAVGIQIAQFKTTDVVVVGAAAFPGLVHLKRNERDVLHAVSAAGGMAQDASGEVILRRIQDPEKEIRLFLRDPAKLRSVLSLDPLQSGDVVEVVAAQPNTIFVGGLVNLPGPREFPPGTSITALQALASAGGIIENVFPKEATLIRTMPNGEDVHVKLDLDRLRSGKDPNLKLAAGDILWVPETAGTRVMAFLNESLFFRAGATVSYNVTGVEFLNRPSQQNGTARGNGGNLQNSIDPLGFLAP